MSRCPFLHQLESDSPRSNDQRCAGVNQQKRTRDKVAEEGNEVSSDDPGNSSILGFVTTESDFLTLKKEPTHYSSYLGIDVLTQLQDGVSSGKPGGRGLVHHEELTFIITHQVFELWFKLMIEDLRLSRDCLKNISLSDLTKTPRLMQKAIRYINRAEAIFHHCTGAFGILETMHPSEFLEFRDYLVPASGFQSVAFRLLEQLLGVPNSTRCLVNDASVFSYLHDEEQQLLEREAREPSLSSLVIDLYASVEVPDDFVEVYLRTTRSVHEEQQYGIAKARRGDVKSERLVETAVVNMKSMLEDPAAWTDGVLLPDDEARAKYTRAVRGALFVMSYRNDDACANAAALLDALVALEEGMLLWRGRHTHMAERMIGRRGGTGGTTSGVEYLDQTRRYRIFHLVWLVRKMLIRPSALPPLSSYTKEKSEEAE
ncbi:putative tryptophan-dioxygenase oxidoreductase protein [Trypanosoma theileri]|uniref:Putative tryptophan-dioxygenase oxidoreductase protein n=1 Tax=Trypanosoma theileri TaxID=67003 RepID=A0A1X0P064_9TRYP|nr:putative tryptophan-dioxygenase oxidoreductase protein [Trypanosoma theileri]ORC89800.1 putative tryptophan-dioxygenase oxidoreductase protein [Trypanosoma theileri]